MDRDKALDMAVGQIEKQYGKGAVMKLGEGVAEPVSAIPTGAISLDVALGIGGVPRGRVTEIYGPESSGKCLVAGTTLWTDRGLETIEEVFARAGQPATCASRVTDVRDQGLRAVNERGALEGIAALTHNGRKPVVRLTLRTGRSLEVTHNHPLRVLGDHGEVVWREAGSIQAGDTVVSAAFGAEEAAAGDGLDEDEAVLLGYLLAEGSPVAGGAPGRAGHEPEVGDELARLAQALLPEVEVRGGIDADEVAVGSRARDALARRYGVDLGAAAGREVPHVVRTAGAKAQRAFLSALLEVDGWADPASTVGYASASATLARQVQLLLLGLGIPASLAHGWSAARERHEWTVTLAPEGLAPFAVDVGARSAGRRAQVEALRADAGGLQGDRYLLERVAAVEDAGEQPTFDLMLPETHSFLANGVLSHNTTVALHVVAEAQRAGGIAAFIDAEHALDPNYAKALGVDTEELLISQPDNGEQALEIADMLVRSGAVDVIVVDSVAALTPRAEIEGEMGDSHVGLQARLMSQALRKLAGTLSRSGTSAVFINQLREKVGVMFGSPETTPGGRALKFYSSVRIDVRRIESLKDGQTAVGNRVRAKIVKNKVSAPFRQAEFDIAFGEGISKEGSLLDLGVDEGIVKKAGAWFTYEGEQLGQGRENAKRFLKEHTDVAEAIRDKLHERLGLTAATEDAEEADGAAGAAAGADGAEAGTAASAKSGGSTAKGGAAKGGAAKSGASKSGAKSRGSGDKAADKRSGTSGSGEGETLV